MTKNYIDLTQAVRDQIKKSTQFHLDRFDDLEEKVYKNLQIFDNSIYKMPYNPLWIDFIRFDQKIGLFIVGGNQRFICQTFINSEILSDWIMLPFMVMLDATEDHLKMSTQLLNIYGFDQWKDNINSEFLRLTIINPIDIFFRLINCKNIGSIDNKPSNTQIKKHKSRGKLPPFTYKTLHIKSFDKKKREYILNESMCSHHNRIHLCRGHFRTYTKEKPLFGKYAGTIWVQPHIRGQNKEGIVDKDYKLT